ncbi:MAG: LamG-like jellyroll fold domain-containing protein [Bacteroidota bacterium]
MNKFFILSLLLVILTLPLFAQDTIEVQTFDFTSETRSGVFEFPDQPGQSFEKILMYYTMRCHDNAVGNGNVGCREWDYSCNTFITDSTRIDSTQQVHPNFIISGFSDVAFDYSNQATYSYYQYEQHQVDYTNILNETVAKIGFDDLAYSIGGEKKISKNQYLFTATELSNAGLVAGELTGLELDLNGMGQELSFLRIKLKHSNKTVLNPSDPDLDGFTQVYFLNTLFNTAGAQRLNFYEHFNWDGSSNILVELSYTNQAVGNTSILSGHSAGFAAALVANQEEHHLKFSANGGMGLPSSALESIQQEMTISLWAYGDETVLPVNTTIFEGQDAENRRQANVHLPWGNGQVYWDCGNDGSAYDRINQVANPADFAGKWSHWAFTKNATTGIMNIYLNGNLWHSGTGRTKPIDIEQFQLGRSVAFQNGYLGQVDELRIWNQALDENTIRDWMNKSVDANHPQYNALIAYFPLNEGGGNVVMDASPNAMSADLLGVPSWVSTRGNALRRNFTLSSVRPNLGFVQGEYELSETIITVLDSVINDQHLVVDYGLAGTDLITEGSFVVYPAGEMPVFDEQGNQVSSITAPIDQTLLIEDLIYYQKNPAKYEILSLVTPYGNGLSLGPEGKTFIFDLTDYSPILKGKKRMSIEMGGQFQEELDIKFQFIKGIPPRNVIDIQNIWPFRRGWYGEIVDNRYFEARQVMMHPEGEAFKIRSAITGHGQNGEFVSQNHFININGGVKEFNYDVWKECSTIPIYPQGGTWLFDRAGWCPGHPTDVHQFDITPLVSPGELAEIDYGLNGTQLSEANYLVSNQLVTYGPPNRNLDVAIKEIMRPSKRVEYQRINPACNQPLIVIENLGTETLTHLTIEYQAQGGNGLTYEWTGNLGFLDSEEVVLPLDDYSFWENASEGGIFTVRLLAPNGQADENIRNNVGHAEFDPVMVFEGDIILNYTTNSRGYENFMQIKDHAGEVVLFRNDMANNTNYVDELDLLPGCYSLEFIDSGDDGLYYWYWDAVGLNVGGGQLRFRKELAPGIYTNLRTFHPEFGRSIQYDFVLKGQTTSTQEEAALQSYLSIYPNPTSGEVTIEVKGAGANDLQLEIFDLTGRLIQQEQIGRLNNAEVRHQLDISQLVNGLYLLKVMDGTKVMVRQLVKQ